MNQSDLTLKITEIQVEAAKLAGQQFFWRIVKDNGKSVDQFDPITGKAQQFPNWVTWIDKSPMDPYHGNPAFAGIKEACWVPVYEGNDGAFHILIGDASSIILFRKNYIRDVGTHYTVYCLGQRWEGDNPKEHIYHICPPTRYHKADGSLSIFPGAVSLVTDPLGANDFDKFLKQNG